jgi:superfamily II RNA helicase
MGLVHAWAKGVSWNDLIANTSLDEGDVVRIMRRTVDLLAQVPYCEAISQRLRDNARTALKAINRFPVCEPIDLLAGGAGLNPATERTTTATATPSA